MKSPMSLRRSVGSMVAVMGLTASLAHAQTSTTQTRVPPNAQSPNAQSPNAPSPNPPSPNAPSPNAPPDAGSAPPTREQVSYAFGLEFGETLHRVGITDQINLDELMRGVQEGLHGTKPSPAQQQQVQEFARAQMLAQIAATKKAGRDFLEHNSHEKGVKTTASGLQYKVIAAGNKKAPPVAPNDEVTVNYRGRLVDGTEFDSSDKQGKPVTFRANAVIQGWQEALLLMKPGAKYQLFIPTELGYGDRGNPGIPPGSALIFDVELVSVTPSAALPASPPSPPAPPQRRTMPVPQSPQSQ